MHYRLCKGNEGSNNIICFFVLTPQYQVYGEDLAATVLRALELANLVDQVRQKTIS